MAYAGKFDVAETSEVDAFSIDFGPRLVTGETIQSATVSLNVISGVDGSPASHLTDPVEISGTVCAQTLAYLLAGVVYEVIFTATTSAGRVLTEYGTVPVRKPGI